jgi:hypothetical protein
MTLAAGPPPMVRRGVLIAGGTTNIWAGGQSDSIKPCSLNGKDYIFKQYRSDIAAQIQIEPLLQAVLWRRERLRGGTVALLSRLAWPQSVVLDEDSRICGILMKPAPRSMYERVDLMGRAEQRPRHLDVLAARRELANRPVRRQATPYCEPPVKLVLLARLLETMLWLHECGYVIGDLHLRNALFDYDGREILVLDCDACVSSRWGSALPFAEPELWRTPFSGGRQFTVNSDFVKFGWAVVRCLQDNTEAPALDAPMLRSIIGTATLDLLQRTCAGNDMTRMAESWRPYVTLWPSLVIGERLYVHLDDAIRRPWLGTRHADLTITTEADPTTTTDTRRTSSGGEQSSSPNSGTPSQPPTPAPPVAADATPADATPIADLPVRIHQDAKAIAIMIAIMITIIVCLGAVSYYILRPFL